MIARLILRRLFLGLVTVWTMSILVFFGIELLPGDVADAMLGQLATPETLQAIRDDLALERPAYVRYLAWLRGFITGDLGRALATGRPIFDLIAFHGSMTLLLGSITAFIAVPLAVSLRLIAATYPGSPFDRTVTTITLPIPSLHTLFPAQITSGTRGDRIRQHRLLSNQITKKGTVSTQSLDSFPR